MALKAMVVKTGLPGAGTLLGVHDSTALPPLPRDNAGTVVAEFVDTAGQGPGQAWDPATRAFVGAPAPTKTSLQPALDTATADLAVAEANLAAALALTPVRGPTSGLRATVAAKRAAYYSALVAHTAGS